MGCCTQERDDGVWTPTYGRLVCLGRDQVDVPDLRPIESIYSSWSSVIAISALQCWRAQQLMQSS
eukprot:5211691-Pyramimonas_sp.AAC.1